MAQQVKQTLNVVVAIEIKFLRRNLANIRDMDDCGECGIRTGPPANVAWRVGTTALCHSRLYPLVRNIRIWPLVVRLRHLEGAYIHERHTLSWYDQREDKGMQAGELQYKSCKSSGRRGLAWSFTDFCQIKDGHFAYISNSCLFLEFF